jgi:hypothetical protein
MKARPTAAEGGDGAVSATAARYLEAIYYIVHEGEPVRPSRLAAAGPGDGYDPARPQPGSHSPRGTGRRLDRAPAPGGGAVAHR